MAVIRVNKNKNYTIMSNYHFRDKNLSLKAKGLLSQMLSLPDEWDYSVDGLVAINKESKTAIQSTLKELEKCGYLVRTKTHDKYGRINYVYDVYEEPCKETPRTENPITVNPCTESMPQLNTNKSNTKELNTNKQNTKNKGETTQKPKNKKFVVPSVEEVKAYCEERKNGIDPERFVDYYEARGWMIGKNHIKDWKACVRTWERNTGYNQQSNDQYKPKTNETPQDTSMFDECTNDDGTIDTDKFIEMLNKEWYE